MIGERTPGEKLAYADGFKQAIEWFEQRFPVGSDHHYAVREARDLHRLMLATFDPPKQPAPNDHWCIGCSPDPEGPNEEVCCGCERPRATNGP